MRRPYASKVSFSVSGRTGMPGGGTLTPKGMSGASIPKVRLVAGLMVSGRSAEQRTVDPTSNRIRMRELGPKPAGVSALTGLAFALQQWEVVIQWITHRERRRRIVVQNDALFPKRLKSRMSQAARRTRLLASLGRSDRIERQVCRDQYRIR